MNDARFLPYPPNGFRGFHHNRRSPEVRNDFNASLRGMPTGRFHGRGTRGGRGIGRAVGRMIMPSPGEAHFGGMQGGSAQKAGFLGPREQFGTRSSGSYSCGTPIMDVHTTFSPSHQRTGSMSSRGSPGSHYSRGRRGYDPPRSRHSLGPMHSRSVPGGSPPLGTGEADCYVRSFAENGSC